MKSGLLLESFVCFFIPYFMSECVNVDSAKLYLGSLLCFAIIRVGKHIR